MTPRLAKSIIEEEKNLWSKKVLDFQTGKEYNRGRKEMLITSERNKAAWNIRRRLAKQRNCKLLDISWKECLATVEAALEKTIKQVYEKMLKRYKGLDFKSRLTMYKSLWMKESEYLRCRLAGMDIVESIKKVWFGITETVRMHY